MAKEYIEREAVLRYLNDIWLTATPTETMPDEDRQIAISRCMGINDAMDAVKSIPAADVVARDCYDRLLAENDELRKERPVVRCGECRSWDKSWIPNHSRDHEHFCYATGYVTHADWYCAAGERKGGDGE